MGLEIVAEAAMAPALQFLVGGGGVAAGTGMVGGCLQGFDFVGPALKGGLGGGGGSSGRGLGGGSNKSMTGITQFLTQFPGF